MAGCFPLLLQLLHFLSTCISLPHLLSLNQSFSTTSATFTHLPLHLHQSAASSFFKPILLMLFRLVPSISSSVDPVYIFHPLYVPLPSSKHLPLVVSKHDHTTSCHFFHFTCCFLQSQHVHQLLFISLVHQLYTAHCPHY